MILDGQNLYLELERRSALLDNALQEIGKRGEKYANAERDYRMALAKRILIARDNAVPVTIINDICRGDEKIANLKLERDCAEASYKAAIEACNVQKLQIKLLENQIEREYRG